MGKFAVSADERRGDSRRHRRVTREKISKDPYSDDVAVGFQADGRRNRETNFDGGKCPERKETNSDE